MPLEKYVHKRNKLACLIRGNVARMELIKNALLSFSKTFTWKRDSIRIDVKEIRFEGERWTKLDPDGLLLYSTGWNFGF
jgi:hypothetical protein